MARTRLRLEARLGAGAAGHAVAVGVVPAYAHVLPGPPTWRSALDALWAALADEGAAAVDLAHTGTGGRGPRHLERDSDEQVRIAALVQLAQGGDKEAFAQLYDAYVDTVFRYVLVRVANRALAEDLTS